MKAQAGSSGKGQGYARRLGEVGRSGKVSKKVAKRLADNNKPKKKTR